MIKINEIFPSIQGEGNKIGLTSVFIRFSGCNLNCSYCDTAHEEGELMKVDQIIEIVEKMGFREVCITGGEPMIQLEELKRLVRELKHKGHTITLETNGTFYDELFEEIDLVSFDIKLPSSKMESKLDLIPHLNPNNTQLKFVIGNFEEDYKKAKEIINLDVISNKQRFSIIFMPVSKGRFAYTKSDNDFLEKLARRVLKDKLNVKVLPQLHKILNLK
ncbi:MAG: 7-carboxy-7-deazaguanine synthase QueE [Candidatus Helarchaeota archaeon]